MIDKKKTHYGKLGYCKVLLTNEFTSLYSLIVLSVKRIRNNRYSEFNIYGFLSPDYSYC